VFGSAFGEKMKGRLKIVPTVGARTCLLIVIGIVFTLLPGRLHAQEGLGFHLPDSIRAFREPIFFPSLSSMPYQSYGNQLSLGDQAIIGNPEILSANNATWKRSFLLGATVYRVDIIQPTPWMAKKESFFQYIQAALGVAELAGVAYLGYKAIKKEPVTKKK
jgi:hypothetical protein